MSIWKNEKPLRVVCGHLSIIDLCGLQTETSQWLDRWEAQEEVPADSAQMRIVFAASSLESSSSGA